MSRSVGDAAHFTSLKNKRVFAIQYQVPRHAFYTLSIMIMNGKYALALGKRYLLQELISRRVSVLGHSGHSSQNFSM